MNKKARKIKKQRSRELAERRKAAVFLAGYHAAQSAGLRKAIREIYEFDPFGIVKSGAVPSSVAKTKSQVWAEVEKTGAMSRHQFYYMVSLMQTAHGGRLKDPFFRLLWMWTIPKKLSFTRRLAYDMARVIGLSSAVLYSGLFSYMKMAGIMGGAAPEASP